MNRTMVGVLSAAVLSGACGMAWAASEPVTATPVSVLDEAHFLAAGDDASKSGDKDAAVQLYQSAIIYAPRDPVPYARLGHYYADTGQPELAAQFFNSALSVQPAYAPALEGLALLALAAGNRAGAQAQHDILVRACGATCPETAMVEKAMKEAPAAGTKP
jgi:tetratricopeptide (TPR) repeat protein